MKGRIGMKGLSSKCTSFIGENLNKTDEEIQEIQYGIDVIFVNISKIINLFIAAYFLGITKYTAIALISFSVIRGFAAGIHANTSLKCNIMNFIIFFGNVYLSLNLNLSRITITLLFIFSFTLIWLYAPADTDARPLTSIKIRKKLKVMSMIVTVLLYIIAMLLKNRVYSNIAAFSIFIEAILITPLTYKIFKSDYKNYEKYL